MAFGKSLGSLMALALVGWLPAYGQNRIYQLPASGQHPIYLSGRVTLDDGKVPPKPVAIQLRCGAPPLTEGHTNSQGQFNLQLGTFMPVMPDVIQDASSPPPLPGSTENTDDGLRARQLMNCELGAQLAGYQSQWIDLGRRRVLDNPDIGVILLHRLGAPEGTDVSSTSKTAPTEARNTYERGLELEKQNKLDEAQTDFQKAVASYPGYAAAWNELGRVQAALGQSDNARTSFGKSMAADGRFVIPYLELSALEYRERRWQQLADISEKVLALDSFRYPQAFFWNAAANYDLHNLERAEERARRAEELDTNHQVPAASRLLGIILAERHDYTGAANELRKYLRLAPHAPDAEEVRSQLAHIDQAAKGAPVSPPR